MSAFRSGGEPAPSWQQRSAGYRTGGHRYSILNSQKGSTTNKETFKITTRIYQNIILLALLGASQISIVAQNSQANFLTFNFSDFNVPAVTDKEKDSEGWQVCFGCLPPYDQPCIDLWLIQLFEGHFFFELKCAAEIEDCPPDALQTTGVWGYTDPDTGEGIGWSKAQVCFDPSTRKGYIKFTDQTQQHQDYNEWEQACQR